MRMYIVAMRIVLFLFVYLFVCGLFMYVTRSIGVYFLSFFPRIGLYVFIDTFIFNVSS